MTATERTGRTVRTEHTERVVLVVPGRPLGANQVQGLHWNGWSTGLGGERERLHRIKHDWQEATYWAWVEAGRPRFPRGARVFYRFVFGVGARRDPTNYVGAGTAKWVQDALTNAEVWPDDSGQWLELAGAECVYRRGEWAVEIEVSERWQP